ncbi:hypothetical protein AB6E39_25845 [Vibrio splendidus]|uniref:hypothetical protein n=1 Tax=Vibrio TaxID=662 RepID=UPI001E335CF8|nr:hypothetical protein [Vibrio splendidus]MCC4791146.1 hypothetical protein [Vibrio splendidus]
MNVLNFLGFDCCIAKRHYANGVIALELIAAETDDNINNDTFPGERICVATTCVSNANLLTNETCIKNYSENTGIEDVLVEAGIIKLTGKSCRTGYVSVPIVEVLI